MRTIIYFHGFQSDCKTEKFKRTQAFFAHHDIQVVGMELDYEDIPPATIDKIVSLVFKRHQVIGCIGCSLGGYWANRSGVLHQVAVVVANPAIEFYQIKGKDIPSLAAYKKEKTYVESNHASRLVVLGTADDVLDYRVAQQAFPSHEVKLVEGGSHAGYDFLEPFLHDALKMFQQVVFYTE